MRAIPPCTWSWRHEQALTSGAFDLRDADRPDEDGRLGGAAVDGGEHLRQAVLVRHGRGYTGQSVLQPGAVQRPDPLKGPRFRIQPLRRAGTEQHHGPTRVHVRQQGRAGCRGGGDLEERRECLPQRVVPDPGVEPVDRRDAELIGDQLTDVCQGDVRRSRQSLDSTGAHLVAVDPSHAVPMMTVGDQHVVGFDRLTDQGDPCRVTDSLDDVFHLGIARAVHDPAHRFAGFAQRVGQAAGEGQTPDRGQVRAGGAGQVQSVG